MLTTARRLWGDLRAGFWFLPSLLLAAHVAMAIALTSTDLGSNRPWMSRWPNLFDAGADGARGMLSTIAGSMMTVVGVTFSMTLVTLALASSQYTSRILRNFISDRITQFVLGLFAGIYCYCLIVLRTIRGGDEGGFVPGLAVLFGVVLAVSGISVLIYFIHHIATSIQASNIIASVTAETLLAVERTYPEGAELHADVPGVSFQETSQHWSPVMSRADGYVVWIDFQALDEIAQSLRTTLRVERGIGDFVVRGTPLVSVQAETPPRDTVNAVGRAIEIGRHRTVDQDVGFGIRQLVDIALRALSPGVNDTTTAVMCVDYLTAIMVRLATREISDSSGPGQGFRNVITTRPQTFQGLLASSFDQIREAGRGNIAVLRRILDALNEIGALPISDARERCVLEHVILVADTAESTIDTPRDRERLVSFAQQIRSAYTRLPA